MVMLEERELPIPNLLSVSVFPETVMSVAW
jgi:hypothetical protein